MPDDVSEERVSLTANQDGTQKANSDFKNGLDNIIRTYEAKLGRPLSHEESDMITNQARDFFTKSTGSVAEITSVGERDLGSRQLVETGTSSTQPSYPPTFSELVALISSGVPLNEHNVPGFKQIPDQLNTQDPSEPRLAMQEGAGQKPWEGPKRLVGHGAE